MMTRRERLNAIFQGRLPDRPAIKLWGAEPGQRLLHQAYQPVLALALDKTDIMAAVEDRFEPCWGAEPPPTQVVRRPSADEKWIEVVTTIATPAGPLRRVRRNAADGGPGYEMEYLIKEPEDLEKLLSVHYVQPPLEVRPFLETDRLVADRGIAFWFLSWGHAPYSLLRSIGSENFSLWMHDHRDRLLGIIGLFRDRTVTHVKNVLTAGVRGVFGWGGPELFVPPLMSPRAFDEFVLPFDRDLIAVIHDGGGRVWVHSHGQMRDMLTRFVDMGVDVLNPIEPPPMGNITLADAFAVVGNSMTLEGNIEEEQLFRAPAAHIRDLVRDALSIGKNRRFILAPTNYYNSYANPPEQFIRNEIVFIQEACACV